MSTNVNQYLMFGVKKTFDWVAAWEKDNGKDFYETFEDFMDDSPYNTNICSKDGIFCLYDGMSGDYIVIGKVIEKSDDVDCHVATSGPISFEEEPADKDEVSNSIMRNFGISDTPKYWLITHYR